MRGGVLLLAKEAGRTSAWCARIAGRLVGHRKAGHTGTLDPMATGLLVVLLGEATKFARFAGETDKSYRARVTFGLRTDTDDTDGKVLERSEAPADLGERIAGALPRFAGEIRQRVPDYSSHKHKGRPFHSYARAGIAPPERHKTVTVRSIRLLGTGEGTAELDIVCGPGTYVRAIARDLGELVGCGAALSGLARTAVGGFRLEDAVSLEDLRAAGPDAAGSRILPVGALLSGMPSLALDPGKIRSLSCGETVPAPGYPGLEPGTLVSVEDRAGMFAGVCEALAGGTLKPRRMAARERAQG